MDPVSHNANSIDLLEQFYRPKHAFGCQWHLTEQQGNCRCDNMKNVNVYLTVREITKSSSTYSATNISSSIILLLQLHDKIQMKLIYT